MNCVVLRSLSSDMVIVGGGQFAALFVRHFHLGQCCSARPVKFCRLRNVVGRIGPLLIARCTSNSSMKFRLCHPSHACTVHVTNKISQIFIENACGGRSYLRHSARSVHCFTAATYSHSCLYKCCYYYLSGSEISPRSLSDSATKCVCVCVCARGVKRSVLTPLFKLHAPHWMTMLTCHSIWFPYDMDM